METTTKIFEAEVAATTGHGNPVRLLPKTWNESHFPYLGDLTPKPTWEIIVKVRPSVVVINAIIINVIVITEYYDK